MFSKKHRLAKSKDISLVYSRGRAFFSSYFTVKVLARQGDVRFAIVVSTKVSKRATRRNSIRRHLRETLRPRIPELRPADYVITVKPAAAAMEPKELRAALIGLFQKTKLL